MSILKAVVAGATLASAVTLTSQAAVFVMNPLANGTDYTYADETTGTKFTVGASPIQITHLGYWDGEKDGLVGTVEVGIYRVSDQSLLASAVIPNGTAGTVQYDCQWAELGSPLTLSAGEQYMVAAFRGSNLNPHKLVNTADVTVDSAVTLQGAYYTLGGTLNYPVSIDETPGGPFDASVGANFQFNAVPEPQLMLGAVGVGLMAFGAWRRRMHKH